MRFWGVRGSLPIARADVLQYGGNTSCVSVDCGETLAVFDAGSGIAELGRHLAGRGVRRIDLFFSHVHWDHVLGLPMFQPLHDPGVEIHIYGETRGGADFRTQLDTVVGPPYWPLGLRDFHAALTVHDLSPGETVTLPGAVTVRTLSGNHPNQTLVYRLEGGGKSLVYALDCEAEPQVFRALTEFARGAGLLVWDASYLPQDLPAKRGWGHSCWEEGAALREMAGIGQAVMSHYAPEYTDDILRKAESLVPSGVFFAWEGMEVQL